MLTLCPQSYLLRTVLAHTITYPHSNTDSLTRMLTLLFSPSASPTPTAPHSAYTRQHTLTPLRTHTKQHNPPNTLTLHTSRNANKLYPLHTPHTCPATRITHSLTHMHTLTPPCAQTHTRSEWSPSHHRHQLGLSIGRAHTHTMTHTRANTHTHTHARARANTHMMTHTRRRPSDINGHSSQHDTEDRWQRVGHGRW